MFGIRRKRTEERFNAEFAEKAECAEKRAGGGHGARGFVESWRLVRKSGSVAPALKSKCGGG